MKRNLQHSCAKKCMGELILLSSGVQMTKGNALLRKYFGNQNLEKKQILLIGDREPEWFALCANAFTALGFDSSHIYTSQHYDLLSRAVNFDYLYMSEGNTFQQMNYLRTQKWIPFIINAWQNGTAYIGVSAGAHIACISIRPAADFDDMGLYPTSDLCGLGLFDGVVIPHFHKHSQLRIAAQKKAVEYFSESKVLTLSNSQMAVIHDSKIIIVDLN